MNSLISSQLFDGLLLGIALFAAPGPKDTLVIRQGVSDGTVWGVVAICVVADAILIAIGAAGIGTLLNTYPKIIFSMLLAGAIYLIWFGGQRFIACARNQSMPDLATGATYRQRGLLKTALILSFANPYAWLDTVVLIGPIGAAKPVEQRAVFLAGTVAASATWFILLAISSRKLNGLFKHRIAWRWLDAAIVVLMFYLAVGLLQDCMRMFQHGASVSIH
ncbi:LysE family transporter [Burkholderia diffusa]|uniref:LysE/ArgO family amino acid transporter n=1 Tax=Burkholderia diffusa TaxID=488732 RepID=UPI00264DDCE9|nr:LysE family transporter [Burkholderia diffusa]MDN7905236.1 LysE family transporter [Burkholderia diffusa]